MTEDFLRGLETKIKDQMQSQNVGFLLGAGSSYLSGDGYPLAGQLWDNISENIPDQERQDIQEKLDSGANGIEHALGLLDTGGAIEGPHRHSVTTAIADHFSSLAPPLDQHRSFISLLSKREENSSIRIFSLNYDPLMEWAAELECVRLFDGFQGHNNAFFDAGSFRHALALRERTHRGRRTRNVQGSIRLLKLHGSLGWFDDAELGIRRCKLNDPIPETAKRLMIPPQYRKAQDTGRPPYSTLWSEFRGALFHGDEALNRLVSVGYGMADEHVNAEIESALERQNFSLIIIAKALSDVAFDRWSAKRKVHIVTEERCSLNGEIGPGHPTLFSFEGLIEGMNRW